MISKPILALAAASFGIGTTEFVIMGLLPDVASGFGVTIPQAGHLVSGYANAVGAWLGGATVAAVALTLTLSTFANRRVMPMHVRPAE